MVRYANLVGRFLSLGLALWLGAHALENFAPPLTHAQSAKPAPAGKASAPWKFRLEEARIEDIHRAIKSRQITCEQLVQAYINRIRAYDVRPVPPQKVSLIPWRLENGREFCIIDAGAPDGIRCDEHGNIWSSAGDGVQVFSPDGKLITRIPVPESPANLCFGGADGRTLFITARTALYSIPTLVRGATHDKDDKVTR